MELGRNLGKDLPNDSENYPVLSSLETENSADIGASKIAHEFGHVDDLRSLGKTFFEQQQIIDPFNARIRELNQQGQADQADSDPSLVDLRNRFRAKFGVEILQEKTNRENRAEKRAIPTIRQIFRGGLSSKAKNAIRRIEGGRR